MENHADHPAETKIVLEKHTESAGETRMEWTAPELRKVDIEEVTANGGIFSADGITSS